jgi:hypothetical protein
MVYVTATDARVSMYNREVELNAGSEPPPKAGAQRTL